MSLAANLGTGLSERDRRALTLLVPAVVAILLLNFAILPWLDQAGDSSRALASREKTLRKYQAAAAAVPVHESSAGALANALAETEKGLFTEGTSSLQGAALQQQVRDLALAAGIQLRSVDFAPLKNAGSDYSLIGVSTQFTSSLDQLVAFLNALQSAPKILAVDQIRMTAANVAGTPEAPPKKQVNIYIVISGVARNQAAAPAAGTN